MLGAHQACYLSGVAQFGTSLYHLITNSSSHLVTVLSYMGIPLLHTWLDQIIITLTLWLYHITRVVYTVNIHRMPYRFQAVQDASTDGQGDNKETTSMKTASITVHLQRQHVENGKWLEMKPAKAGFQDVKFPGFLGLKMVGAPGLPTAYVSKT